MEWPVEPCDVQISKPFQKTVSDQEVKEQMLQARPEGWGAELVEQQSGEDLPVEILRSTARPALVVQDEPVQQARGPGVWVRLLLLQMQKQVVALDCVVEYVGGVEEGLFIAGRKYWGEHCEFTTIDQD
jgi:hypothetical protein